MPSSSNQRLASLAGQLAPAQPSFAAAGSSPLPTRPLFRGGPLVSAVGLGAWPLAGAHGEVDPRAGVSAVQAAVRDYGMTFIDTAQAYQNEANGGSEDVIGVALAEAPELKAKAFVTTKVSYAPFDAGTIRKHCKTSLANLQFDSIELLQLHHWNAGRVNARTGEVQPSIGEQMAGLKAVQDEGLVKYIGLNNANAAQLQEAWDTGVRFHTVQVRYHMFARYIEKEVIPWCREHGVGILAHSVLGKGLCTGKHASTHIFPDDDERSKGGYAQDFSGERWIKYCAATDKLKVIAARRGYSCAELAVGWVLRKPEISVALVGAKDAEQVALNSRFMQDFTAAELAEIDGILAEAPDVGFQGEE